MTVLQLERNGSTAVLTINRPAQRNALDCSLREAFAGAIPQVRDDPGIRALVIAGAGGHFCAGGDVKGMSESSSSEADVFEGRERMRSIHRWLDELVDLEKPVIAAVDGAAFGAGLSLMLAADFVLASPTAKFCTAFARMGYVPDMGMMYTLPRAVGLAHAKNWYSAHGSSTPRRPCPSAWSTRSYRTTCWRRPFLWRAASTTLPRMHSVSPRAS